MGAQEHEEDEEDLKICDGGSTAPLPVLEGGEVEAGVPDQGGLQVLLTWDQIQIQTYAR